MLLIFKVPRSSAVEAYKFLVNFTGSTSEIGFVGTAVDGTKFVQWQAGILAVKVFSKLADGEIESRGSSQQIRRGRCRIWCLCMRRCCNG